MSQLTADHSEYAASILSRRARLPGLLWDLDNTLYPVRSGIWGGRREPPRGLPAKPVLRLLLLIAVVIVIASFA